MARWFYFFLAILLITVHCHETLTLDDNFSSLFMLKVFEDKINASAECVRNVLKEGLPEFKFPSFEPLKFDNVTVDLDKLNITGIRGNMHMEEGICEGITSWTITSIKNDFILIPPTYTVHFALHYDKITCRTPLYAFNITLLDQNIWGKGSTRNTIKNMDISGIVKGVVTTKGVEIKQFEAPVTIEHFDFEITGLMGDDELSKEISEMLSEELPNIFNETPEIFTEFVGPAIMSIFNSLVNKDVGIGIVKTMAKKCIIDIIFPPH